MSFLQRTLEPPRLLVERYLELEFRALLTTWSGLLYITLEVRGLETLRLPTITAEADFKFEFESYLFDI